MKKTFVFALCTGVCLPFFSACVDSEYDISDENLDKKAVISGEGIDVPPFNKLEIKLKEQIEKLYHPADDVAETMYRLKWRPDDGVAYFEYEGKIPSIDLPTFEPPTIEIPSVKMAITELSGGDMFVGIPVPFPAGDLLFANEKTSFDATVKPVDKGNLKISEIKKIAFNAMEIVIEASLEGLTFEVIEEASITITVTLPEQFTLKPGGKALDDHVYTEKVPVSELTDADGYTFFIAEIDTIDYSESEEFDFKYTAKLTLEKDQKVTMDKSKPELGFTMKASAMEIAFIDAKISGDQTISDEFGDFAAIEAAFGENTLIFRDPSLKLDFTTNLGVDFDVDLTLNGRKLNKPMEFRKPTIFGEEIKTSYVLSPRQEDTPHSRKFDIDSLFKKFPDKMAYEVAMNINDPNARIQQELLVGAGYTFNLPFEFTEIELNVKDTLKNIFPDNMFDEVLAKLTGKYLEIAGDVNVVIPGMKLELSVEILGEDKNGNKKLLPLLMDDGEVLTDGKLSIKIDVDKIREILKEDKAEQVRPRHVAFTFKLSDKDGSAKITENDYILIENVRFVSDGGIEIDIL
ncbi:hypothetical protein AGMMS49965_03280 [Bacteroidia bacterium]|nr:hypothetical protein AGMMS49965_03280 [Bacteroidia bacterium]